MSALASPTRVRGTAGGIAWRIRPGTGTCLVCGQHATHGLPRHTFRLQRAGLCDTHYDQVRRLGFGRPRWRRS